MIGDVEWTVTTVGFEVVGDADGDRGVGSEVVSVVVGEVDGDTVGFDVVGSVGGEVVGMVDCGAVIADAAIVSGW